MSYALIFPGQASQRVGMGVEFRNSSPAAAQVLALVDEATQLPLQQVMSEGPPDRLTDTRFAQPAIVATSLAGLSALQQDLVDRSLPQPAFCAGHSVGELSAFVAAGSLDIDAALRLVARRSQLMSEACGEVDGTMAAVLGLGEPALRELCLEASSTTGLIVEIANLNAPDQLVVSGHRQAISWLEEEAPKRGARRVILLRVAGPFHSAYMRPAAEAFAVDLADAPLRPPRLPLVLNQTARASSDVTELRRELSAQIATSVRWSESLQTMAQAGCELFIEIGSGDVLTGLVRRTLPGARALSVQDQASLGQAVETLQELSRS